MATTHYLKTWPQFYGAVARGDKNFEVRKDDRAYQAGDTLTLQYYDPENPHDSSTPQLDRLVTFVLRGGQFGVEPGYVVMGLAEELRAKALPLSQRQAEFVEHMAVSPGDPEGQDAADAMFRAADALSCLAGEGWRPKVKRLDWHETPASSGLFAIWTAEHAFPNIEEYRIIHTNDRGFIWRLQHVTNFESCETLEAAKAAAQEHYDRRILSALDLPAPSVEEKLP